MHLVATTLSTLDETAAAVDLAQTPAEVAVLSFSDSDLSGIAAAHAATADRLPSLRLASLADLRHPYSTDLWIETVGRRARFVLVRLLGGLDWWRYGVDELAAKARTHGFDLAVLPGDTAIDERLDAASTLPVDDLRRLRQWFQEGGPDNLASLLAWIGRRLGRDLDFDEPRPLPATGPFLPARRDGDGPIALLTFYRSFVAASDTAPIAALADALADRGFAVEPRFVTSLKDPRVVTDLGAEIDRLAPAIVVNTTAFSARLDDGGSVLDRAGVPVLQAFHSTATRDVWAASSRGLGASDLAMNVVLPEIDGRIATRAISFKGRLGRSDLTEWDRPVHVPDAAGIAAVADLARAWVRLAETPRAERRIAVVVSDYPAKGGRTAHAVGLDTGASLVAIAEDLAAAGFDVAAPPAEAELMARLERRWTGTPDVEAADTERVSDLAPPHGRHPRPERSGGEGDPAIARPVAASMGSLPSLRSPGTTAERTEATPIAGDAATSAMPAIAANAAFPSLPSPLVGEGAPEGRTRGPSLAATEGPATALIAPADRARLSLPDYAHLARRLPAALRERIETAWGPAEASEELEDGAFVFPVVELGRLLIAVQPDRGRRATRKAEYHDTTLAPSHRYVAFHLWLAEVARIDALVHLGAHGTLEWLPGRAAAPGEDCTPTALIGPIPVVYPFVVVNPGEAAQAKRRIAAVTVGHLTPPLTRAGSHGAAAEIEALLDELSQAQTLDARRARLLTSTILDRARETGLAAECGLDRTLDETAALLALDAWLCDLKDARIGDGLHVFGRASERATGREALEALSEGFEPAAVDDLVRRLAASPAAERAGLIAALDGRFVAPGPAGALAAGRLDVLPTGRNLHAVDPRGVPTRTAWEIGRRTAEEVIAAHVQERGDWPRAIVLDLWGSASMRTGGDDLAQAFALIGVKPVWDAASARLSGFEVLPTAIFGRPRVDVTLRISGLFRDVFESQIALFDAAVRAVAALDEDAEENPLAARVRAEGATAQSHWRIFGAAPGGYGIGLAHTIAERAWGSRDDLARRYLDASGHAFGRDAMGVAAPAAFAARVAAADAFVHVEDLAGRDVLEADAFAEHEGGFAAAAASLGARPVMLHADTTRRDRPKIRTLSREIARAVRTRAANPRWLDGQMRHGHRGGAEIAETVSNLCAFAALSDEVASTAFDQVFDATLGDDRVRDFLVAENPLAARAIARDFDEALRRGHWASRRNSVAGRIAETLEERE